MAAGSDVVGRVRYPRWANRKGKLRLGDFDHGDRRAVATGVKATPSERALADLSTGGGQELRILTPNPDRCAYVAVWIAGLFGGNAEEGDRRNEAFLSAFARVNASVTRLEIRAGDEDSLEVGSKALAEVLEKRGIKHELQISGSGLTRISWRHYLARIGPMR
jgi:hypothetical protein